ncbi:MAG: signal peptidase I [Vicinamibacterales bacterium]
MEPSDRDSADLPAPLDDAPSARAGIDGGDPQAAGTTHAFPLDAPTGAFPGMRTASTPAPDPGPQTFTAVPLSGFGAPPAAPAGPGFVPADAPPSRADRLAAWHEEFWAWMKTLASAALYAVVIVTFVFQVARVEGLSMAPTLDDQDRLIVNKLIYRISSPRRGDIVMLYYPLDPDKMFVKRVIAEEDDQVRIVDGRVYVNDVPMPSEYVPAEYQSHDDWGPQVVPHGHYFVMGDHRNNSQDSRHFGFVPKRYIVGKVQVRWWPVPTARTF